MATTKHKVIGKAMWSKVFDSNKELRDWQGNPHDFGGLFKIDVILDKENKAKYKSSGTSGKGKFDDDGNFLATFKRKEKERFEWAGGPPQVLNKDDTPFTGVMIPNGSVVEVEFTVYTTSMSPGTRLESVKVLELAELPERKEEAPAAEEKPKSKVDMEIPF
jgi:hypothetical protein